MHRNRPSLANCCSAECHVLYLTEFIVIVKHNSDFPFEGVTIYARQFKYVFPIHVVKLMVRIVISCLGLAAI